MVIADFTQCVVLPQDKFYAELPMPFSPAMRDEKLVAQDPTKDELPLIEEENGETTYDILH